MIACFLRCLALCTFLSVGLQDLNAQVQSGVVDSSDDRVRDSLYFDYLSARAKGEDVIAIQSLENFTRRYPTVAAPWYDLARLELKRKNPDAAEKIVRKAVQLDTTNIWYLTLLGDVLAVKGKFDEAAQVNMTLATKTRFNDQYLQNAVTFFVRQKKYQEALKVLEQLVIKGQDLEDVLLQKQEVLLRLNRLDDAIKVATQLSASNQDDARFIANLANVYNSNGRHADAKAVIENGLARLPGDPILQSSMAEYYRTNGSHEQYVSYLEKVLANATIEPEIQLSWIQQYLQDAGRDTLKLRTGERLIANFISSRAESAPALILYAQVLAINGNNSASQSALKRALALDKSQYEVWQQLLYAFTGPEDADSLIAYSEKALRYYPNQASLHYLLGVGHFNKKQFVKAVKSINRAIELQPDQDSRQLSGMYSTLGDAYYFMRELKKSDEAYEAAIKQDPQNVSALNNYAYYLSERGERLDSALKFSKMALDLRPGEATFLDTYGWILYKQRQYPKAKEYLENALKAAPHADGTVWDHLGDVYYQMGDKAKALDHWKRAKERGTDNPLIDKKIAEQKILE